MFDTKNLQADLSVLVILVLCLLAACSPGGSVSGRINCSYQGEVCITISTVQFFEISSPVPLKITVTSSKDFPDLHVTLVTAAEVIVDGPQTWENFLSSSSIERGVAYWDFPIKAGQPLIFNRVLHFPSRLGYFNVNATVVNTGRIIEAIDSLDVLLSQAGGIVARAGTRLPVISPNVTSAVYGPGTPVPTHISATLPRMKTPSSPVRTSVSPLIVSATPPPYPPPASPTPSPTPRPYP